jgi:23S rRNA pseudouridine2605 synthase
LTPHCEVKVYSADVSTDGIRLQKALAQAGVGSRRACDALVGAGRIRVNGIVADLGTRVDPASDEISLDGQVIEFVTAVVVLMLNKPAGIVTTMSDDQGRPCVGDLVRGHPQRLFHVGRLDEETEGLLLLTNDGDMAHRLMHPSHGVQKTYVARVRGRVSTAALRELLSGVELGDGYAAADEAAIRIANQDFSVLEIVLHEGRKHIVRRMCKAIGHPVERLTRTRLGSLELGDLALGEMRELTLQEHTALIESILK